MFEFLSKHGVAVAAGFLIGLALVVWVQPNSRGGQVLLMAICIALAVLLRAGAGVILRVVAHWRGR